MRYRASDRTHGHGSNPDADASRVASAGAERRGQARRRDTGQTRGGRRHASPKSGNRCAIPRARELAENEYRKAVAFLNQGRLAEAEEGLQAALNLYPEHHQARQGLLGLLVQGKKLEEAERVLEEGVRLSPAQTGFSMTLARLQADRGDDSAGDRHPEKGLEYAQGSAEYVAFLAALLQRQGRHEEAIEQFQAALRLRPGVGRVVAGARHVAAGGQPPAAAQDAYRQARAAGNLQPELAALAEQRLSSCSEPSSFKSEVSVGFARRQRQGYERIAEMPQSRGSRFFD